MLNHELILDKVQRVFNPEDQFKPYLDMTAELRMKTKNDFGKDFFKLMNNSVLRKTIENVGNHRDIKLVTTNGR